MAHEKEKISQAHPHTRSAWVRAGAVIVAAIVLAGGVIWWMYQQNQVYVDSASVEAPLIDLAPTAAGKLQQVFVNEGDSVPANTPVAQVGTEVVSTKVAGIIVSLPDTIGAQVAAGQPVAEMIDPSQLRVVGKVDEDKGLSRIAVGDPVTFTVDAFGGKQFAGVVDEIAPTSEQSGIVFNISDQRETMQFDVKARFDTSAYPELKNGMSARMWIYPEY